MTKEKLYSDLASWYPLLTAPADYVEEAAVIASVIDAQSRRPVRDVLELGCGAGANASHLKERYAMTLTDLSDEMLALSARINPKCRHVQGDMRTLRLDEDFDAVLAHDAVMYMRTETDLLAAMHTAFEHLRPGGVALFLPDETTETFQPRTMSGGHDGEDGRAMRYLEWVHDPDPTDTEITMTFVYVMRDGTDVRVEHEDHINGLFTRETWTRLLGETGFEAKAITNPCEGTEYHQETLFLGIRR